MYLHATFHEGRVTYAAWSDALVSAGLAASLIETYSGQTPESILKGEPSLFKELEGHLTPGRSNGLAALWLKMKQQALSFLVAS
ncbi:MAG: hypothetical protein S4CHLAM45_03300 [Chlamydiales bacterium]|nr:hypothetical protein [Chlamydiales bacterium]MCH9619186.1 hypothetical protein [Chlamydiales bacterium]MCH9622448.1 hypothetical protein [Chlamydiales bacterium]